MKSIVFIGLTALFLSACIDLCAHYKQGQPITVDGSVDLPAHIVVGTTSKPHP